MTKLPRLLPWQALHATATLVMQLAVAIFPRAAGASPEMSVTLVDLVLKARMPLDMQSRAAQKLVLVCLAKVCQTFDLEFLTQDLDLLGTQAGDPK